MEIKWLSGKELDCIAGRLGLKRRRHFWIFKESDKHLRARLETRVFQITSGEICCLHCKVGKL